jgi:hypothetical protein
MLRIRKARIRRGVILSLLILKLHDRMLRIIKVEANTIGSMFSGIPFGDESTCKIWAEDGTELECCKKLEQFAINKLSNYKYKTLSQLNNLERMLT